MMSRILDVENGVVFMEKSQCTIEMVVLEGEVKWSVPCGVHGGEGGSMRDEVTENGCAVID